MLTHSLPITPPLMDVAGFCPSHPTLWHCQTRLQTLIHHYLNPDHLCDRLADLPVQFCDPQPRPWRRIDWHQIDPSQIIGIDPLLFVAILAGSADTEDPIRGYTQTSRQYLAPLYPDMARFVGGTVDANGQVVELGLWEKEERQHAPALQRLYTQLTGLKLRLVSHEPRPYQPTGDRQTDLYRHGLHRVATEYGATCLYLWLMAHTTGPLQAVLAELLTDEINHMTKFWGFGCWAFPDTSCTKVLHLFGCSAWKKLWQGDRQSSLLHTLRRMAQILHWDAWSLANQVTFLWTFDLVLRQLQTWNSRLTPAYLQSVLGENSGHMELER